MGEEKVDSEEAGGQRQDRLAAGAWTLGRPWTDQGLRSDPGYWGVGGLAV